MSKEENDVNKVINEVINRNKSELNMALIEPISPKWKFSSNGIYLFIGKPGSGKTYYLLKHIMMSEKLFDKPYYNRIIFCSTSAGLDKTVLAFSSKLKTPISYVNDEELMPFLRKHIKTKKKYYALYRYVMNNFKKPEDEVKRIIEKKGLTTKKKQVEYIAKKFNKYGTTRYPLNCLVVLDDMASHPLLQRKESELSRLMTKCRHYNLTFIIAVQTPKFILKNLKRMCTDVVLYKGCEEEDFKNLMKEVSHPWKINDLWEDYRKLENNHGKMIMNLYADSVSFEDG